MKWAAVAGLGVVVVAFCAGRPVEALPVAPEAAALSGPTPSALLPVRYWRHHRHYRHEAREASPDSAIKPGQWEFTSRLQNGPIVPPASPAPGAPATPQTATFQTSRTACIASDNAVPAEFGPQCRLDSKQRQGSQIRWSMSCASTGVRSDGAAQYHGDTMEATMVSHLPVPNGARRDLTQHIAGRYLGPCPQSAQAQAMQQSPQAQAAQGRPEAAMSAASGSSGEWVEPAAAPPRAGSTTAPAAENAVVEQPPTASQEEARPDWRHLRSTHRSHRHYRHYRHWHAAWLGGPRYVRGFGPAPYSSGGP